MVLKNKRGLSKLEFYHNARRMRKEITELLLRDLGIRDKVMKVKGEDGKEQTVIEEYPDWLIVEFRRSILTILRNLMMNITAGNSIYPVNPDELHLRRRYQTAAIVNCEQLLQEFLYCEDVLPVQVSKYLPFVDKIEFEIALLKGWRKSNNKLEEKLLKR
jgi:hypothetical protein